MPDLSAPGDSVDPWTVLQRLAEANPPVQATGPISLVTPAPKASQTRTGKLRSWLLYRFLDLVGTALWLYAFVKLFVFDIDRAIVERTAPSLAWLLDYRFLIFLFVVATVALFLWRKWTVLLSAYVAFFPFVVLFWKVPNLVRRLRLYRSWIFWMLLFQSAIAGFRNLRFLTITASLGILCTLTIALFDQPVLLVLAAAALFVVLFWTAERIVRTSVGATWFLKQQRRALDVVGGFTTQAIGQWREQVLAKGSDLTMDRNQLTSVAASVWMGAVANRVLYLWAYKLQQYQQSSLGVLMNVAAFILLYLASVLTFGLANLALLKIDPTQFRSVAPPSGLAMILYGFSSFFRAEGGGVSAAGDWAYALQIAGGIYGWLFLGVVVTTTALSFRTNRDQRELRKTVAELRHQAHTQDAELREALRTTVEDALERFRLMGFGSIQVIYDYFKRNIPEDFMTSSDQDLD